VEQLYAFFYQPTPPLYDTSLTVGPGWTIFNPREEFARMGVGSRTKAWRFTDINKDYQVRAFEKLHPKFESIGSDDGISTFVVGCTSSRQRIRPKWLYRPKYQMRYWFMLESIEAKQGYQL
jgi:hypothetical protein